MGLTKLESDTLNLVVELWNNLSRIAGDGPSRPDDLRELAFHVHAIQAQIMAQSLARTQPNKFRLLGESIGNDA